MKLTGNVTNKGTKDLSGSEIEVELDNFYFSPTFIKGGTPGAKVTVHLKNDSTTPHTFTSSALGVDQQLGAGEAKDVQITLPQSGATEFHCRFHQQSNGMQGAFFFKDGDSPAGAGTGAGGSSSSSSSSSSDGGYQYPN
ncbi:MAG: Cupredoxin-like domain [Acidimicrobiaceae bacterium]